MVNRTKAIVNDQNHGRIEGGGDIGHGLAIVQWHQKPTRTLHQGDVGVDCRSVDRLDNSRNRKRLPSHGGGEMGGAWRGKPHAGDASRLWAGFRIQCRINIGKRPVGGFGTACLHRLHRLRPHARIHAGAKQRGGDHGFTNVGSRPGYEPEFSVLFHGRNPRASSMEKSADGAPPFVVR